MNIKRFRTHKRRHLIRRKPINVLASVMTTMNLYCGIASIFASIGSEFEKAAVFILVGIIFDTLDGAVARITKSTSDFGKELDSLCDIVTFGVAPGVLVFCSYLPDSVTLHQVLTDNQESIIGRTGSYMAIVYIICAALRLARFNTFQAERSDYFTGLPSPAAGGLLASFILFLGYYEGKLEAMNLGAFEYLNKPIRLEELRAIMDRIFNRNMQKVN
ncbi:MAG: CDP-diacylglycerol--serine O-phosphatidyltransferase [Candidatus Hydrogenedentes bacterium]|nr:CDP-diacylglycerol--serine O-phosphatidyltransferase [Candidatus Hydrogenedentota bacterium]